MVKAKVIREFGISKEMISLVQVTDWGGRKLVYAVRHMRKWLPDAPEAEVMNMPLVYGEDGLLRPPSEDLREKLKPSEEMKQHILAAYRDGVFIFKPDLETRYERIEFEQDPMVFRSFTIKPAPGSDAGYTEAGISLTLKQNGRWMPTLADLSLYTPEELQADGINCPDDGFESPEQFRDELKRLEPTSEFSDITDG